MRRKPYKRGVNHRMGETLGRKYSRMWFRAGRLLIPVGG